MTLRPAIKTVSSATSIPGLAMSREASLTSPTHHTGSAAANLLASPRPSVSTASGTSTGAGFPRTNTINSTVGENKYRRKVGFEAFDTGADTLFTFTCQVGLLGGAAGRGGGGGWAPPPPPAVVDKQP